MKTILTSIHAHPTWWVMGAFFLFSNAVSALPSPRSQTGVYRWVFDFAHLVAANAGRIIATRTALPLPPVPGPKP